VHSRTGQVDSSLSCHDSPIRALEFRLRDGDRGKRLQEILGVPSMEREFIRDRLAGLPRHDPFSDHVIDGQVHQCDMRRLTSETVALSDVEP
jgi:hypothetical protein